MSSLPTIHYFLTGRIESVGRAIGAARAADDQIRGLQQYAEEVTK